MNQEGEKYLLISLQGELFAFDLAETVEVEDPRPLCPIPSLQSPYCGAMNFHGRIVAVADLAVLLGLPACQQPDKTVILAPERADLAFLVERVIRIASPDDTATRTASEHPYLTETITFIDGTTSVLDCAALVSALIAIIEG